MSSIHKLINFIWNKEELPDQGKESIITPVHKKGDKTGCNNYRGISLLSTSYKFLLNAVSVRPLFIDFKKAYGSVRMDVLCNILIEFGVYMKLVQLIKMCLNEAYSKVHIGTNLSDTFPIQNSLKQGDDLSPLRFNFALEFTVKKVQENQVRLKLNGAPEQLSYADDVNLLGDNIETIKKNKGNKI
jgi:hypothetical protein